MQSLSVGSVSVVIATLLSWSPADVLKGRIEAHRSCCLLVDGGWDVGGTFSFGSWCSAADGT